MRKWMYESEHSVLVECDSIGTSKFHISGLGAEHFTRETDVHYDARDRGASTVPGQRALLVAIMILRDGAALNNKVASLKEALFSKYFCGPKAVYDAEGPLNAAFFRYDPTYLGDPSVEMRDVWCSLHLSLAQSPQSYNVFDVVAYLATTAFAKNADVDVVQTLCAFYRCPDLATIQVPDRQEFHLAEKTSKGKLGYIIDTYKWGRPSCPEAHLVRTQGETSGKLNDRKKKVFGHNERAAFKKSKTAIAAQWEADNIVDPDPAGIEPYLNLPVAMADVRILLHERDKGQQFDTYLERISLVLSR